MAHCAQASESRTVQAHHGNYLQVIKLKLKNPFSLSALAHRTIESLLFLSIHMCKGTQEQIHSGNPLREYEEIDGIVWMGAALECPRAR